MKKKTIYDLASELNIAPSTISKALNNKKGVNLETRNRIVEYAKENGYVANPTARALKSKHNYTIGILYSELSNVGFGHPFFSMILQYSKEYLENHGYDLIFINSKSNDYQTYSDFCITRNIAGVLIASISAQDQMLNQLCKEPDIKVVATDYINDDVLTVLSDNKQAITDLVDYFKKCNYKNVGIICTLQEIYSFKERYDLFLEICKENNINVNKDNIIYVDGFEFEDAYRDINLHLKSHKAPEALFALSDIFAVAAIRALTNNNYKIPQDCAIVGFDDIELARYVTPSLSTIRQDCKKIGQKAARLLLDQLEGKVIDEKIARIKTKLVIRDSSKKVGE